MDRIKPDQVHKDLDVHYFADYAMFTGAVREYVAKTLEQNFKLDPNDLHRRLCIIGLYKEEYAAYEDLGAFLNAIIRWNKKEVTVPFESILRYKDDKVALNSLFKRHKMSNSNELMNLLDIDQFIPANWHYPKVDCRAGLIGLCNYIAVDCLSNQKEYGVNAYNKIKHGLILFPNGEKYAAGLPNCPAVMINNNDKTNLEPYTLLALPMSDVCIEQRAKTIEFVQATTRILAALYVINNYPGYLRRSLDLQTDSEVFLWPAMRDVWSFFRQIADKYANEAL